MRAALTRARAGFGAGLPYLILQHASLWLMAMIGIACQAIDGETTIFVIG